MTALVAPTEWRITTLEDVAEVCFGTRVTKKVDSGSTYPVYGGGGATFYMDEFNRESCVVISRFGMSERCVRRVEGKFFLNDSGLTVESKDSGLLWQPFLDLQMFALEAAIYELGRGTAQKNLNVPEFRCLPVFVPPLDEQKRIVAALDQAFTALDRACANIEANASDSAGLGDRWLSEVFHNGCDWPTRQICDVCENLDRERVPITKADREPGDIPYYGASGVVDYVKGFLFDEELLLVSEDGANLLARSYPIAFSIRGKAWVNNHAHVLRFSSRTTQEFVRLYLNSISLTPYVTGMAQPKLNQAALNSIRLPMPSLSVQESIVGRASEIEAASDQAAAAYKSQLEDIAALRQSLLQAAFSGQLS